MQRTVNGCWRFLLTAVLLFLFANCKKSSNNCTQRSTIYTPIFKPLAQVRANMVSGPATELEITGRMFIHGNYIFLNEYNRGIHIIDNSQPNAMKNIAFINIPGNFDMAVTGNMLYADAYGDLVAFDISDPLQVKAKQFLNRVFPQRSYYYYYGDTTGANPDSIKVVAGFTTRDTIVSCPPPGLVYDNVTAATQTSNSGNVPGLSGSTARFTIVNDYLYAVDYTYLNVFTVATPQQAAFVTKKTVGDFIGSTSVETIYPFKNKLFVGSTNGMFIYDVASAGNPVPQGKFLHVTSCDPVIADDNYAWVTLRGGTRCNNTNQLHVLDIKDFNNPSLIKTYNLTNPYGLSKDGNLLFICDGKDGLKIFNAADPNDVKLVKQISGLEPSDVIAYGGKALVVAKDGLYQFYYGDLNDIRLLSKVGVKVN